MERIAGLSLGVPAFSLGVLGTPLCLQMAHQQKDFWLIQAIEFTSNCVMTRDGEGSPWLEVLRPEFQRTQWCRWKHLWTATSPLGEEVRGHCHPTPSRRGSWRDFSWPGDGQAFQAEMSLEELTAAAPELIF